MKTVVVPPLLCSALAYVPLLDAFWSHGQVTIADTRRDDTIAAMAERVLRENEGDFALLGTSMGGYVALEVMRQAPERIIGLALCSTSARADSADQKAARRQQSAMVEAGQFATLIDAAFPSIVSAENESNQTLLDTWRAMTTPVGAAAFLRQQHAVMDRSDLRSILPAISCPTAIIHGAGDRLIPIAAAEESASLMPAATFTVIEEGGHFFFHEQPTASIAAINAWQDALS